MKITTNKRPPRKSKDIRWENIKVGDMFALKPMKAEIFVKINNNKKHNSIMVAGGGQRFETFGVFEKTNYIIITDISINNYISTIPA